MTRLKKDGCYHRNFTANDSHALMSALPQKRRHKPSGKTVNVIAHKYFKLPRASLTPMPAKLTGRDTTPRLPNSSQISHARSMSIITPSVRSHHFRWYCLTTLPQISNILDVQICTRCPESSDSKKSHVFTVKSNHVNFPHRYRYRSPKNPSSSSEHMAISRDFHIHRKHLPIVNGLSMMNHPVDVDFSPTIQL